jgi:cytoskeletal protein RodZ
VIDMELGEKLREARTNKDLTLQDIQEKTKIQKRYLEAIESGNYQALPGAFYARAFIREFALVVGLNPNELLEEHAEELPSSKEEEFDRLSRVQKHKTTSSNKNSAFFSVFPKVLTAVLIVGIIAVVWYSLQNQVSPDTDDEVDNPDQVELERGEEAQNNDNNDGASGEGGSTEDEPEPEPETEPEPEPEPEPTLEQKVVEKNENGIPSAVVELSNVEEFKMTFETDQKSWLDIKNGKNKVFYSDNFKSEESPKEFDFTGESEIRLNIGLASALKVTINDTILEYPFDPSVSQNAHQIITLKVVEN